MTHSTSLYETRLVHRNLSRPPPIVAGGEGVYLIDTNQKRYLDASGGAAVSCLGHSHPEVLASIHRQIDEIAYAHSSFFSTEAAEQLALHLTSHAPQGLDQLYLVSGGSEAVEAALKMARQYFVEIGESHRRHFIARRQSYHGNTLGALAVSGNEWRRRQFEPLMIPVTHVSPCYEYRERQENETPEAYGQRLVAELAEAIDELGGKNVIAFIAETVGGATSGAITPVPGYFGGIRKLCDQHGILLILDEVMCGMGRCGTRFAFEHEGISPDLLCMAKGLAAGYQPIGAVLARTGIVDALRQGSGIFQHGHTYNAHATACAAALAVQKIVERDELLAQVRCRGAYLRQQLLKVFASHPNVGDIRGRGLLQAIELVAERHDKTPFDPVLKCHARVKIEAMANGLVIYPMGGTIDGLRGDHVLLAPPFIVTEAQIDEMVARLRDALDQAVLSL